MNKIYYKIYFILITCLFLYYLLFYNNETFTNINSYECIVVSAYFKIPSKKNHEFYMEQVKRFLSKMKQPIVFFTTPDLIPELSSYRQDYPIKFIQVSNIYELDAFKKYSLDFWKKQSDIDQEKYHTPELAAIWYNKKEFVLKVIDMYKDFKGQFIWCDAGCIRNDNWNLNNFGKNLPKHSKISLQLINNITIPDSKLFSYPNHPFIAGAIITGNASAWKKHSFNYDQIVQKYIDNNITINSDQYIYQTCILIYPDDYDLVYKIDSPDEWFFFLHYL
jgi:hypothetical protein